MRRLNDATLKAIRVGSEGVNHALIDDINAIIGPIPVVAISGMAIHTDHLDRDQAGDEGVTYFMAAMSRDPRIAAVYQNYLDNIFASGATTFVPYTLTDEYSASGLWGHLEYIAQDPATSPKYTALLDYYAATTEDGRAALNSAPIPDQVYDGAPQPEPLPGPIPGQVYDGAPQPEPLPGPIPGQVYDGAPQPEPLPRPIPDQVYDGAPQPASFQAFDTSPDPMPGFSQDNSWYPPATSPSRRAPSQPPSPGMAAGAASAR
jgi:hypothetical protein